VDAYRDIIRHGGVPQAYLPVLETSHAS
jgi:hypothetical protein